MSATELRPAFRQRFRAVTRQIWSLHVGRGVALTVVVATVLVAVAAAIDYVYELPWAVRVGVLAAVVTVVATLATRWIVRPALAWNRARVAAELEEMFPRLGQRLRTATQHGARPEEELKRDGVSPCLVAALESETAVKVKPLPFQAALPVRPMLGAGLAGLCSVALLAAFAVRDSEWRTALLRLALAPAPYTTLTANPSADEVVEGETVEILATMSGRVREAPVLHVREPGEADWRRETMEATDDGFTARLVRLQATTEFFVSAGPEHTSIRQVRVLHPLKIADTRIEVTAPDYTGVTVVKHEAGSFSAIQGSTAKLLFELDRDPVAATLVVRDPAQPREPARRIDMAVQGRCVSVELPLSADLEYAVEARDSADMPLVANRHRVRVIADQPPTVWFDEPRESMEVHTLAEVLVRARARDDFGVTRMGIIFQVNNEEERMLVLSEVDGQFEREARADEVLMLEQFLLTQKDCVAYYAFAEDNRPGLPHRTTTDLRFIDIRPFQRIYRLIEPMEGSGGPQRDLIFLDEVIARQRFNLNQTMRLETRSKVRLDLAEVEKIAAFENKLATQTHELADFLIGLGVDGAAILAQAEEAMLSAVDSLQGGKFPTAIGQERDALRYLMEARDTIQLAIIKQPRAVRAQARAFDRLQRQKLRRNNEDADTLLEIAQELARLANEEDGVARGIAGMKGESDARPTPGSEGATKGDPGKEKSAAESLLEKQDEVAGRATALEKVAAEVKGLTGLARKRIADAAAAANAGADALGQGNRPAAQKEVDRARELFRLASKQVAALAAEETAQQIAAARDIANDLALQTAPAGTDEHGANGSGEGELPGLGNAAEEARTLKDIMERIAGLGSEEAADAASRVGALLKHENLQAAIERMEKPGAGQDRGERRDLAERFAALGQKLDQAYRETVAPRLEELARLEREAYELGQRAGAAGDASEWRRVRQQAGDFVRRLDDARLGSLVSDELRNRLSSGSGNELLGSGLAYVHKQLVAKLQEFVAGDRLATGDEAVPPEYRDLVDRYLRALSAGSSN